MGIFDYKQKESDELTPQQQRAFEIYNKQLKSLSKIVNTDGYKEIKAFFERVSDCAKDALTTAKEKDIVQLQSEYKIANNFLQFLNNLESKLKP